MTLNEPKIHRMSPESAEICKLSVNCFITTKIAFAYLLLSFFVRMIRDLICVASSNMIADIAAKTPGASGTDILAAVGDDSRIGGSSHICTAFDLPSRYLLMTFHSDNLFYLSFLLPFPLSFSLLSPPFSPRQVSEARLRIRWSLLPAR